MKNKKGVTILELLISISVISIVILLLIKVMFSLTKINNSDTYASSDEIGRTEIIKNIESDFLKLKLNGFTISNTNNLTINFTYENETKKLVVEDRTLTYDNETYTLESNNATYNLCPTIIFEDLENDYYLLKVIIPVLIKNENTTENDDIILTYLGLKNEFTNYQKEFTCSKK